MKGLNLDVSSADRFRAGARIKESGLKEVAKLKQQRLVNLEDTKVTESGVTQLQKALPKSKIKHNAKE